ncbi:cytochrome P450 [Trinickia caryophylli]|uniref:Cytochrome P450 n=1 Tax=Trinickia caryophylli TaxID=28094 RepID=A0A1X7HAC5_TRICW|nr:cytochrome P450 [Trinickia caryophylli]WQE14720.1 cytochrome P450 [Trinickia caryophylli]GLU31849.1 cytochrome P450 [Trinickia caryophylli]SMF81745.1 hypothetical protein SAMN06295900_1243 [Trinickia caryophylli]
MDAKRKSDWDPRSEEVRRDQVAVYDEMRGRCPVAHSEYLHWSLFRHEDVMRVLNEPETFSSAVSHHLSVPNGMDPPEHAQYREIIEPYFDPERMAAFEPKCRSIAASLVDALPRHGEVEFMAGFAEAFAMRIQCAFLGWPGQLHVPLREWVRRNHAATLSGDKRAMGSVAVQFDGYISALLTERRRLGCDAPEDITTSLMRAHIGGRPLSDPEIVSILRNWTVGELGTIAACVGILAQYLAVRPDVQEQVRAHSALLPAAIDEILRIRPPLIANRRVAAKAVNIGGRNIEAGERITLIWASADRDEAAFGNSDEFRLDRDPDKNLLYGAGIHACPGAPLARLELRVVMEELLAKTTRLALVSDSPSV